MCTTASVLVLICTKLFLERYAACPISHACPFKPARSAACSASPSPSPSSSTTSTSSTRRPRLRRRFSPKRRNPPGRRPSEVGHTFFYFSTKIKQLFIQVIKVTIKQVFVLKNTFKCLPIYTNILILKYFSNIYINIFVFYKLFC